MGVVIEQGNTARVVTVGYNSKATVSKQRQTVSSDSCSICQEREFLSTV
jgi:hypothetical protein